MALCHRSNCWDEVCFLLLADKANQWWLDSCRHQMKIYSKVNRSRSTCDLIFFQNSTFSSNDMRIKMFTVLPFGLESNCSAEMTLILDLKLQFNNGLVRRII